MSHSNELKTGCDTVELFLFVGGSMYVGGQNFPSSLGRNFVGSIIRII